MSDRMRWLSAGILAFGLSISPALAADPSEPVTVLDNGLLQAMKSGSAGQTFDQRLQALQPAVDRAFNLSAVLRHVVGLRWDTMSADQQHGLLKAFTRFTVASYVANFNQYGGQHFELSGTRTAGTDQVIGTTLVDANGSKAKLDYVVQAVNGYWQITDVLLDGSISRAAVMRSDFRSLLVSGGPEALIQNLNQKADDLAKGKS